MKFPQKAVIFSAALAALILSAYWFIDTATVYDVKELEMNVYVGRIVGMNVDTDKIYFGTIAPGGGSFRSMTVTAGPYRSLVSIQSTGDISEWVYVSDNNFVIEANESMKVEVSVRIPENEEIPGYRDGVMRIVFRMV